MSVPYLSLTPLLFLENELSQAPLIFWFYVCSQYFPFRALELAQKPLEEFVGPILEKLKPNK
jgi:hypothetical protein